MPLPDRLARLNRRVANPLVRTFAGRVAPLAIVQHRGRSSGRAYQTPVLAFAGEREVIIVLFYGSNRDWVKNVQAAGGCTIFQRGKRIPLSHPVIVDSKEGLPRLPALLRPIPRLARVTSYLRLRRVIGASTAASVR